VPVHAHDRQHSRTGDIHPHREHGTLREAVQHLDVARTKAPARHVAAPAAKERLAEHPEALEPRTGSHLPLQQDPQPVGQRRLVEDQVGLDPVAHPSGVIHVQSSTSTPGAATQPRFSQAVVVEHPSRTVYVGGQNGVTAGLELARSRGPDAIGLREITRVVGVTPNAAYRHFTDRAALVRAAARRTPRARRTPSAAARRRQSLGPVCRSDR